MKRLKQWIGLLLVCFVLALLPVTAQAAPSTNYTLTGNQAQDVVSVGLAQNGKVRSDFGYNADWCSYWVCWVGRTAGANYPSSDLGTPLSIARWFVNNNEGKFYCFRNGNYNSLIDSGITKPANIIQTSRESFSPQAGDLICYLWDEDVGSYNWSHIGIVISDYTGNGLVGTVEGNTGNSPGKVGTYNRYYDSRVVGIIRPNYTGSNTLTIKYNTNGGSISSDTYSADSRGLMYKSSAVLLQKWPYGYGHENGLYDATTFGMTRKGYTFAGWSLSKDGSTRIFDQSEFVKAEEIYPDLTSGSATVTLYAIWTRNPVGMYKWISAEKMGDPATELVQGTRYYFCYKVVDSVSLELVNSLYSHSYTVVMEFYNSDGILQGDYTYTDSDNNWVGFTANNYGAYQVKITIKGQIGGSNINGTQSLDFVVSPKSSTVYFDANGGSVSTARKTVTYGSTYGTLPTPTRSGYSFDGWFTSPTGGEQITSNSIVNILSDQTLYACWTQNTIANGICGNNIAWTLSSDGVMTISGTGAMWNYTYDSHAPWYSIRDSITNVKIGNGVTSIGGYAFYYCQKLKNVVIPSTVASIGENAFAYCILDSVTIPASVTSIGGWAFYYCPNLTVVTIPSSVTSIGMDAFSDCSALSWIEVDGSNSMYRSVDGVLYNKGMTQLIQYPVGNTRTSFAIPSGVTNIGRNSFAGCTSLTSVTIPEGVTSIGLASFDGCEGLTSILLPTSVTSIGNYAFRGCDSLESFYVTSGNQYFYSTGGVLFNKDMTKLVRYPEGRTATAYTVPEGTVTIGNEAFYENDSLVTVRIPGSVTCIGAEAFRFCSNLKTVYYSGTKAQWDKISVAWGNDFLLNAEIVYVGAVAVTKPTLTVSKNTAGKPYLTWTAVSGATKYEIYFSTDCKSFTKLTVTTGTKLTHGSAESGKTYYYMVCAWVGGYSVGSSIESITCGFATPTLTVSKNTSGKPYLTWTAVDGATKYEVYYSADGETFNKLIATTGKVLTHSSAKTGTTYYYKVRAITDTTQGAFSAVKSVSVAASLTAPTLTVSKNTSGKPYLKWTAVTGATKYEVYSSTDGKTFTKLIATTGKVLTHSSAKAGVTYYYKVRAITDTTKGAFSAVKSVSVAASLTAPTLTVSKNTSGKPYLSWTAVDGATKYEVYYSVDGKSFTKLIATSGKTLTHSSAKTGTTYYYKVRAITDTTQGAFSAVKSVSVAASLTAPTLTVSKNTSGKPYLTWTAVTGATKYEVYYSTDGDTFTKLIATTGKALTHSSAKTGTTYYYKVRAITDTTQGAFSAVKSVSVAASLTAPTLTVSKNTSGKPYLTWTAVTGATKYEVYYSVDGKSFNKLIATTGKALTHSSAKTGTTYYYKVRAITDTTQGAFSAVVTASVN